MGAYSPAYGLTVPAPVARWSASGECPAEFAAVIGFGRGIAETRLELMDPGANGAVAYEYAAAGERRWFFFATREGAWSSLNWASDAAVLCFAADALFFAGGSYVEYAGKRAVECRVQLPRLECRKDGKQWSVIGPDRVLLNPAFLPGSLR
jgi:hypothetical protein